MLTRYPDIPSGEISRDALDTFVFAAPDWFCKLKMDGWRCVAEGTPKAITYYSKTLKPLVVHSDVARPFENAVRNTFGDSFILDCELTGNRREGDARDIIILECLQSIKFMIGYDTDAYMRWQIVQEQLPHFAVPATLDKFGDFYDTYKQLSETSSVSPSEGVVLMRRNGKAVGSRTAPHKHPGIVKCKWRAGFSGTTMKE